VPADSKDVAADSATKDATSAMEVEKTKESTSSTPEKTADAAAEPTKVSTRKGKRVAESAAAPGGPKASKV